MADSADVASQVRGLRDLARQARRLGMGVSNGDRKKLFQHADELEHQADELERRGQAMPPPVVQVQMQAQQQQQHEAGPPPTDDDKPKG